MTAMRNLVQGNVVVLGELICSGELDYVPPGSFLLIEGAEPSTYADGYVDAFGVAYSIQDNRKVGVSPESVARTFIHEGRWWPLLRLKADREVTVSPECVYRTDVTVYTALSREELPEAERYAWPRDADYIVTRPSGIPRWVGYVYERGHVERLPIGAARPADRPFDAHLINGVAVAPCTCLLGAVMLIAAETEEKEGTG